MHLELFFASCMCSVRRGNHETPSRYALGPCCLLHSSSGYDITHSTLLLICYNHVLSQWCDWPTPAACRSLAGRPVQLIARLIDARVNAQKYIHSSYFFYSSETAGCVRFEESSWCRSLVHLTDSGQVVTNRRQHESNDGDDGWGVQLRDPGGTHH